MNHTQQVRFLYKTILRLHRGLPCELRQLGDQYAKDEFRRHKSVGKEHIGPFMVEWTNYCAMLAKQVGLKGPTTSKPVGKSLHPDDLELFEGQQIYQLYELRQSISPISETQELNESISQSDSLENTKSTPNKS